MGCWPWLPGWIDRLRTLCVIGPSNPPAASTMKAEAVGALLVIAVFASPHSASAQRLMFLDASAPTRRFGGFPLAVAARPDQSAAGDTVRITFRLINGGGVNINFCLGHGYGIELATPFDTVRPAVWFDQE